MCKESVKYYWSEREKAEKSSSLKYDTDLDKIGLTESGQLELTQIFLRKTLPKKYIQWVNHKLNSSPWAE